MRRQYQSLHVAAVEDSINLLSSLPDKSVKLVIADPPYNIDIDYWDQYDNYVDWAKNWIEEVYRVLSNDGNFVLFGGFQFQNKKGGDLLDLMQYIRNNTKLNLVNVIVWHYKNGITARRFFANRHEEIIWYTKSKKYTFNLDDVRIKYDKKTFDLYCKDKRLNPESLKKGKNPTNVWEISRLNSNSKERVGHITQKPETIIRRIVRSMSDQGNLVIDIFGGSGITTKVCIEEKRCSLSTDIDENFNEYINRQLNKLKGKVDYRLYRDIEHIEVILDYLK